MLVAIRVTRSKGLLVLELGKDGGGTSEATHALDVHSHMLTQIPKDPISVKPNVCNIPHQCHCLKEIANNSYTTPSPLFGLLPVLTNVGWVTILAGKIVVPIIS
jgi:hypothetical protein